MPHDAPVSRTTLITRDAADPLARFRDLFHMPDDLIYLDGNSLGPLPKRTVERMQQVVQDEWGRLLIRGWTACDWINAPSRIGGKIARLIGAHPDEVICADSTSVNLFKTLAAALALKPGRHVILSTPDNFPTDLYMAQGLIRHLGGVHELRLVDGERIEDHLNDQVAVLLLTHVNYKTGRMYDLAHLTQRAHACGALTLWDLAHSAGAVPMDLNGAEVDFAVGCGYKYLNGGPGAPAYLFVARQWQSVFSQPLSGWMGHATPFAFDPVYEPAPGIGRYLCGTPPILSMAALECGIDLLLDADMQQIRAKSLALTDLFIQLVEMRCAGYGLELMTPRDHAIRGSQVSFRHPQGYALMQALIAAGVIGDFRAPDIVRFGFAPLYLRFVDVWDAVDRMLHILEARAWDREEFRQVKQVT
ncbi:MAG: kynureninase [Roseiflexus castenholzii]|uniref:kynureninase n=1 Tax=Roseiflexus castenholzii TaxID=120962 RepID=UPI000CADB40E|nr:MAG: kynureninase [Roseiflexus castenholzii]